MSIPSKTKNNHGFIKVAATSLPLRVADLHFNTEKILEFAKKASSKGAKIIVFPELCITGYTVGDLFNQRLLLEEVKSSLSFLKKESQKIKSVLIVGLPLELEGKLFNVAAVISRGRVLGIVPKTYIPGYKEFYEERWFASGRDLMAEEGDILDDLVPIGSDLLFRIKSMPGAILGIEICEDIWSPLPPSSFQVVSGATIVANLSASNDIVGKGDYRKELVSQQSARGICGYIYSSCSVGESSTDIVFGGHIMVAENGSVLSESTGFSQDGEIVFSEIDIENLMADRERMTSFGEAIHESRCSWCK
jgi:NAD+ synthase (glutamine-hydrolysing)